MAQNAVTTIKPHLANTVAPDALRSLQGWLVWRYEQHDGEPKPRKVPYYTNGGRRHGVQGRPEDRNQLTMFDAAKAAAARRGFDGVGLALMPEFGIVALDFDHCMTNGGVRSEVLNAVSATYAEFSPSGEGVRAFFKGNLGNLKAHGEPFGFELFSTKGFVTFTGNRLDSTDILGNENTVAPLTAEVTALVNSRFGPTRTQDPFTDTADALTAYEPKLGLSEAQLAEMLDVLDPDAPHQTWLNVGMALHHETDGQGFALWDEWSAGGSKYPGEAALQKRWDSFGEAGTRPVTARSLIKLAKEHGAYVNTDIATTEDFTVTPAEVKTPRFPIIPAGEFSRGKRPGWIVKQLLPRAGLVVVFGESGSGKTFEVLDIVGSIVRGVDWRGLKTQQGRAVYIAAEGGGGFRNRLTAYEQYHQVNLDDYPLGVIHAAPNFLQKTDAVDVAHAIQAWGGADIVVVDTFAQVTPGANENAAEDMGKALAHCAGIHRATGATIILIHHAGKDASKGSRGWSGLRAAADAEIEIVRTASGRMLRVSKQKDGDDTGEWGFALEVVNIGVDEDGDVIDSCVAVEAQVPVATSLPRKLPKWQKLVMEVVQEIAESQTEGIEIEAIVELCLSRTKKEEGKKDTRKQQVKRAIEALSSEDDSPLYVEGDCLSVL